MGKSIKNRIFGSDVPDWIKHKLELRQAYSSTSKPGDSIINPINQKYNINESNVPNSNFMGVSELSSRTPFVRMWSAVNLTKDVVMGTLDETEAEAFEKQRNEKPESKYLDNPISQQFLSQRKSDKKYVVHYWQSIPDSTKIYQLGNHILNNLPKDPTSTRENLKEIKNEDLNINISKSTLHSILPNPLEFNSHLSPPAGITGLSSTTDGPLGTLKRTTVKFVVHDFNDFERIYLRYFLRPGAQVFVDFGWDTAQLYDVNKMMAQTDMEKYLFGDDGVNGKSNGDMETLIGHVVNYDAKARQDGGFDCSIEIVSKNGALLSSAFDPKLKERVKYGLDIEALSYAVSDVIGQPNLYVKAQRWSEKSSTQEELRTTFNIAGSKLLGGLNTRVPGDDTNQGVLALEHGVYFGGAYEENQKLWINFGWIEDKFLNKEFGFSDSAGGLINQDKDSSAMDQKTFKSKFNSRNSFVTYSQTLADAVNNRDFYNAASVIYPSNWGDETKYSNVPSGGTPGITYNIKRNMIPDRFDANGDLIEFPDKYPDQFYKDAMANDLNWNPSDTTVGRIPLRELFLSYDMIKESIELSESVVEFLENMMKRIKESTNNIIDLELQSNSYAQNSVCFVDKNMINREDAADDTSSSQLLEFKPYHPSTIVKNYDLNFSMPKGGLGNIIAIQNTNNLSSAMSINDVIDGFLKQESMERRQGKDVDNSKVVINYTPSVGQEAGKRFASITGAEASNTFAFGNVSNIIQSNNRGYAGKIYYGDVLARSNSSGLSGFKSELTDQVNLAVNPDRALDGDLTDDKGTEEKTSEDTTKRAKEIAQERGETLVSTPYEYYLKMATDDVSKVKSPLIAISANLDIYGTAGFVPGDLIKIDYLPKHYRDNVFFQVMKVSHEVGTTWSTNFETQMRVKSSQEDKDLNTKYRISKSYLRDSLKLEGIDDFLPFLGNLKPVEYDTNEYKHIDYVFDTRLSQKARGNMDLPILWTRAHDDIVKKLNIFTSSWNKSYLVNKNGYKTSDYIEYVFNNEFEWFGLKKTTNGIQSYAKMLQKDHIVRIWVANNKFLFSGTDMKASIINPVMKEAAPNLLGASFEDADKYSARYDTHYHEAGGVDRYNELVKNGHEVTPSGNVISSGKRDTPGSIEIAPNGQVYRH